jgi:hypothetical protein
MPQGLARLPGSFVKLAQSVERSIGIWPGEHLKVTPLPRSAFYETEW